MEKFKEFPN